MYALVVRKETVVRQHLDVPKEVDDILSVFLDVVLEGTYLMCYRLYVMAKCY